MNLVIVFLCRASVLCFIKCPFVSTHFNSPPPPVPTQRKVTKFCSINLANPKLGPFIVCSPLWLLICCPSLSHLIHPTIFPCRSGR